MTFASMFFKQLNKITLQPDESMPLLKSSVSVTKLAHFAYRIFFGSSSAFEVSLRSLFFEEPIKNLKISFMIINESNNTSKICS